jgi:hypothetical protein
VHREDRRGLAVARDDIPATYTQINRIHIIGTLQIGIIGIQIVYLAPISCFGARELRAAFFFVYRRMGTTVFEARSKRFAGSGGGASMMSPCSSNHLLGSF